MSAELMVWGHCPSSVVRPSVRGPHYLWTYCMNSIQILVDASPGPYAGPIVEFLIFLWIFFLFVNMGPYGGSQKWQPKSQPKTFKRFLNFLPNDTHKTTLVILEILKIEILMIFFFIFLHMGSQNFKTLLLLQITYESFQNFPWIFFPMVLTKFIVGFLKFWVCDF